jgi:hypothetical protein
MSEQYDPKATFVSQEIASTDVSFPMRPLLLPLQNVHANKPENNSRAASASSYYNSLILFDLSDQPPRLLSSVPWYSWLARPARYSAPGAQRTACSLPPGCSAGHVHVNCAHCKAHRSHSPLAHNHSEFVSIMCYMKELFASSKLKLNRE